MFFNKPIFAMLLGLLILSGVAHGQTVGVGQRLNGYMCVAVATNNPPASPLAPLPPLYGAPSENAPKVGAAQATMIAADPPRKENGFLAVYFGKGREAWVKSNLVSPWRSAASPTAKCHPAMMTNGLWAFDYKN